MGNKGFKAWKLAAGAAGVTATAGLAYWGYNHFWDKEPSSKENKEKKNN